MPFDINSGKQRMISVSFTKADGSSGEVEGLPTWELSDTSLATLEPAADGKSVMVRHSGGAGPTDLTMRADGDLGSGVFPIVLTDTANMMAPLGATAAAFTVGDEQDIATPRPVVP